MAISLCASFRATRTDRSIEAADDCLGARSGRARRNRGGFALANGPFSFGLTCVMAVRDDYLLRYLALIRQAIAQALKLRQAGQTDHALRILLNAQEKL